MILHQPCISTPYRSPPRTHTQSLHPFPLVCAEKALPCWNLQASSTLIGLSPSDRRVCTPADSAGSAAARLLRSKRLAMVLRTGAIMVVVIAFVRCPNTYVREALFAACQKLRREFLYLEGVRCGQGAVDNGLEWLIRCTLYSISKNRRCQ